MDGVWGATTMDWDTLTTEVIAEGIWWAIAGVMGLLFTLGLYRWRNLQRCRDELRVAKEQLEAVDARLVEATDGALWSRPAPAYASAIQLAMEKSPPVVLVANHKGGVGKTTLALNLGAYVGDRLGKRVLFIDFDYQGTLSSTLFAISNETSSHDRASALIDPREDVERSWLDRLALAARLPGAACFTTAPALARTEERVTMRWALGLETADARFRLARMLHESGKAQEFDFIVIDAPPRSTLAEINAICAATHLIVPTRIDDFSLDGARDFLNQATELRGTLSPKLHLAGLVGTMLRDMSATPGAGDVIERLRERFNRIGGDAWPRLTESWTTLSNFECLGYTYSRAAVAELAGRQPVVIAPVNQADKARPEFEELCAAVCEQLRRQGARI